jgi:hypothetical protein
MKVDRMQTSRFELKYIVDHDTGLAIRDFVRSFLDLDENGVGQPDYAYPVHSIYLDSQLMKTYQDTINGNKNRYKLRIRFYDDKPESPVFFELKRRMNNCIMKQRGTVRRHAVQRLMDGFVPGPDDLFSKEPKHLVAVQNFVRLVQQIGARPQVHVAYRREAYVPHNDNSARLTLDREVRSEKHTTYTFSTKMTNPIYVWGKAVVVELKFTNRFPTWFGELVRVFGLRQCGAAKYADGVALLEGKMPKHKNMPRMATRATWGTANVG